jgi:dTDP-4-dehydrorhamnose reductase
MASERPKILITGGSGLVGAGLAALLAEDFCVDAASHGQLEVLERDQVFRYVDETRPCAIVHTAAYLNAGEAEKERGNLEGLCYRTNVYGTQAVVDAGNALGIPTIYISTGSVFNGNAEKQGPFGESDPPVADPTRNNWYGYTKYLGERTGPRAVIRVSHPAVPERIRVKDGYIQKIIHLHRAGKLFPLFTDQLFPLTYLPDLARVTTLLVRNNESGIFHVASADLVSPYELTRFILQISAKALDDRVKPISIEEFYAEGNSRLRFAQYAAISSHKTAERLGIAFASWRECVRQTLSQV